MCQLIKNKDYFAYPSVLCKFYMSFDSHRTLRHEGFLPSHWPEYISVFGDGSTELFEISRFVLSCCSLRLVLNV